MLSGLPHLTRWIFSFVFGIFNQYQTCIQTDHFRKLATGLCKQFSNFWVCIHYSIFKNFFLLGTIGVGILTVCLAYTGCNTELAITVLFMTITLQGTITAGPYASAVDMTPNFSSELISFSFESFSFG